MKFKQTLSNAQMKISLFFLCVPDVFARQYGNAIQQWNLNLRHLVVLPT